MISVAEVFYILVKVGPILGTTKLSAKELSRSLLVKNFSKTPRKSVNLFLGRSVSTIVLSESLMKKVL